MDPVKFLQKRKYTLAGAGVEVARRLIGKENRGAAGKRARQGDTLLLASRQFAGAMVRPVGQTDFVQHLPNSRPGLGGGVAADQQWHGGVFRRGEFRQKVVALPNEPDRPVPEFRHSGFGQRRDLGVAVKNCALGGGVKSSEEVK